MMDLLIILKMIWMWVTRRVTYTQVKEKVGFNWFLLKHECITVLFMGMMYGIAALVLVILIDLITSL